MKALPLLRVLTPLGWLAVAGVVLVVILMFSHGLGVRWDPFGLTERRLEAAEDRAAAAHATAAARRIEHEGATDQARRLEDLHQQAVAVARGTAQAAAQARSAHDADISLDPDRAARLIRHDRELCRLAPAVCGASAPDPSPGGDGALQPGSPD